MKLKNSKQFTIFLLIMAVVAIGAVLIRQKYSKMAAERKNGINLEAIADNILNDNSIPKEIKDEYTYLETEAGQQNP